MKFSKKLSFQILISILFLIFLFYIVKPSQILGAAKTANLSWIFLAILLLPLNMFFQFFRWRYLVKILNSKIKNGEILKSIFYSYSYSIFTPARLGDIGRAFHISHESKRDVVTIAVYEKFFAFAAIMIFGFISLSIYKNLIFLAGALLIIIILFYSKALVKFIPFLRQFTLTLEKISVKKLFFISISFVFVYVFQFYLLLNAFHAVSLEDGFFMICLVVFFNSVPITLNGLGVREVLSVYFFKNLGVTPPMAASASFLLFSINILIPTFIGFLLHLLSNRKKIESEILSHQKHTK